jgi:hypothetical protein
VEDPKGEQRAGNAKKSCNEEINREQVAEFHNDLHSKRGVELKRLILEYRVVSGKALQ